jgi:aminopeptidase-like protein
MTHQLYQHLFELNRSLLGTANNQALRHLKSHVPLHYHRFPSGTKVLDWTIPKEWIFRSATLTDLTTDTTILTTKNTILHVVNYSQPFTGEVSYRELLSHLYYVPTAPRAIPYRTSYYTSHWGLCLAYEDFLKLDPTHRYHVHIDTSFKDGILIAAEAKLPGISRREVILTSYLCHPRQAHDGLSGVMLLVKLYQLLRKRKNYYTYRFFFIPETIGSLALLATNIIQPRNVEYALVATCVGAGDVVHYKKTFTGRHTLDHVVQKVLKKSQQPHTIRDFWPQGSEERQLSSPKIRIPTGSVMGNVYQEYPQYHTSADDLSYVSLERINYFARLYAMIIREYERYPKLINTVTGGEPFLTKYDLYRTVGVPGHSTDETKRSWLLFFADGQHTLLDVAALSGFSETELKPNLRQLVKARLIKELV